MGPTRHSEPLGVLRSRLNGSTPTSLGAVHDLFLLGDSRPAERELAAEILCARVRQPLPEGPDRAGEFGLRAAIVKSLAARMQAPAEDRRRYWPRRALGSWSSVPLNLSGAVLPTLRWGAIERRAPTSFTGAVFLGAVVLGGSTFRSSTDFEGASFDREAVFSESTFAQRANFADAVFSREAMFVRARFAQQATFENARFDEGAVMGNAVFEGQAVLRGTHCRGDLWISGASFNGGSDWTGARLETVQLHQASFADALPDELAPFTIGLPSDRRAQAFAPR